MFDIVAALLLLGGTLLAADLILLASRAKSTIKPDWKVAVLAGGAAMIASELTSLITWQFAFWSTGIVGPAAAGWLNSAIAAIIGSIAAAFVIRRRFGLSLRRAYLASIAGVVPAFLIYSLLLGLFTKI